MFGEQIFEIWPDLTVTASSTAISFERRFQIGNYVDLDVAYKKEKKSLELKFQSTFSVLILHS